MGRQKQGKVFEKTKTKSLVRETDILVQNDPNKPLQLFCKLLLGLLSDETAVLSTAAARIQRMARTFFGL